MTERTSSTNSSSKQHEVSMRRFTTIIMMFLATVVLAQAQGAPSTFSLSISPVRLTLPVAQLVGELSLGEPLSVAGKLGVGYAGGKIAAETGAQLRFYAFGGFTRGLYLGAEGLFASVSENLSPAAYSGIYNGFSGSGLFGAKFVFDFGLTVDVTGGLRISASGVGIQGDSTIADRRLAPLADVNIGWTF